MVVIRSLLPIVAQQLLRSRDFIIWCFWVYLNNPINNMKIALELPTDHVSHMAKRTHLWKAQCTYPRNKYFLTYRIVLISKLQTALIFSIVISVPFNEYSATVVFASYVVLLHAVKVIEFYERHREVSLSSVFFSQEDLKI